MLKEPGVSVDSISEALYYVGHGIQFKNPLVLVRYYINIPEDRCSPLEQLKSDIDDLQKVSEEYHNCTGGIAQAQDQDKLAKDIIKELQPIDIGIIPIYAGNDHKNEDKEHMYKHGCYDLNDR